MKSLGDNLLFIVKSLHIPHAFKHADADIISHLGAVAVEDPLQQHLHREDMDRVQFPQSINLFPHRYIMKICNKDRFQRFSKQQVQQFDGHSTVVRLPVEQNGPDPLY